MHFIYTGGVIISNNKYNFKYVKEYIENEGYVLLSDNYTNCKDKLIIKCEKGHIFNMNFDKFKNSNSRCPICNTGGKFKYDISSARQIFEINGCKLLENEYKNCDTPMNYICSCGNKSKISLSMFMSGQRCYKCRNSKISDVLKNQFTEVYDFFKINGCELLSHEYANSKTKLKYRCSCGNISMITFDSFKSGTRCKKCMEQRKKKIFMEKYGVDCPLKNNEIREKIKNTLYKNGTAPCSSQQKYIHSIIGGELNFPVNTLSLDIAFPEEKIYFEYDGGLHDGQVKFGILSENEFRKKEFKRTYALIKSGWKEIRLISRKDHIPSDKTLLEIIKYSKDYLNTGHHYIKFDIDNSLMINSQGVFDYQF